MLHDEDIRHANIKQSISYSTQTNHLCYIGSCSGWHPGKALLCTGCSAVIKRFQTVEFPSHRSTQLLHFHTKLHSLYKTFCLKREKKNWLSKCTRSHHTFHVDQSSRVLDVISVSNRDFFFFFFLNLQCVDLSLLLQAVKNA